MSYVYTVGNGQGNETFLAFVCIFYKQAAHLIHKNMLENL